VIVLFDDDTALYSGSYYSFDARLISAQQARELYWAYLHGDNKSIALFHEMDARSLCVEGDERVSKVARYPILADPTPLSVVQACDLSAPDEQAFVHAECTLDTLLSDESIEICKRLWASNLEKLSSIVAK